ncbi:MAG TPA: hypothetical protein VHB21_27930, partial [Minicystis sp.]|nr:hypothetical protein [Minicystis sp.]
AAEIFEPAAAAFTPLPKPPDLALADHTATLLPDGSVLIVGGVLAPPGGVPYPTAFATVFEPRSLRWNVTGLPHAPHWKHAAVLLPDGAVVVAGGEKGHPEIYVDEIWKDLPAALAARLDAVRPPR